MKRQGGATGLFVAAVLVLVVTALLATLTLLQNIGQGDKPVQEAKRFESIKAALVQYVATNGRLPCPANPSADTGDAVPTTASATCTNPTGTVPWLTLGMRRDDAVDSSGWKISYRVYTGTSGSLAQASGASMVNCDISQTLSAGRTQVSGSSGGLCRTAQDTTDIEFLAGKGLAITWFGTAVTDAAFVLVSHGPSGLGAYTSSSTPTQMSSPTNASELANMTATGPFVATTHSASSVGPADSAHFDDLLAYMSLKDLVRLSGLSARDWPDTTGYADVTLNMATVAAALESSPSYGALGQSTLNVNNARVTGLASGVAAGLTFATETSGVEGLGGAAGGTRFNSAQSEGLRIEFNQSAAALGITLNHFGIVTSAPNSWTEQVRLDFYDASGTLLTSVTKAACNAELSSGTLASFSVDPGVTFTRVDVTPILSTVAANLTTRNTNLLVSAFNVCASAPCNTALSDVTNACS